MTGTPVTEPKALFDIEPKKSHEGRGLEPRPLFFDEPSEMTSSNKNTLQPALKEPGALSFEEAPPNAIAVPVAPSTGPKALILPESFQPVIAPYLPTHAVFRDTQHPGQVSCETTAKRLEPNLFAVEEIRIRKYIQDLLPVSVEHLQHFGVKALNSAQVLTDKATHLSVGFSKLNAAELLDAAMKQNAPKTGFFSKLASKLSEAEDFRPRIASLEAHLKSYLAEALKLIPETDETGKRLAIQLLALRAVEQQCGIEPENLALTMLHRKLTLYQNAVAQASLAKARLSQMTSLIATLEGQCEHLLRVTLSAIGLAHAIEQSKKST